VSTQPIAVTEGIKKEVEGIGEEFLKLEKYVNLNYTGFHKILKKHDRYAHTQTNKHTHIKGGHNMKRNSSTTGTQ
jgi:SPX domain protein involved in polyphosphate accumulation